MQPFPSLRLHCFFASSLVVSFVLISLPLAWLDGWTVGRFGHNEHRELALSVAGLKKEQEEEGKGLNLL